METPIFLAPNLNNPTFSILNFYNENTFKKLIYFRIWCQKKKKKYLRKCKCAYTHAVS